MTVLNRDHIGSILPQQPPFLMVDGVVEVTEMRIETRLEVRSDNLFLQQSQLSGYGLVEHIAQSGAIGLAIINGSERTTRPANGFLAGLSKLEIGKLPLVGSVVNTVLEPVANLGGMYLLKAESYAGNHLLISCEIKLAIQMNENDQ